jgi:hypothetical protein
VPQATSEALKPAIKHSRGAWSAPPDSLSASAAIILAGASLAYSSDEEREKEAPAGKLEAGACRSSGSAGNILGTVEAPNEKAAEAAAVAEFDLSDEQRGRLVLQEWD